MIRIAPILLLACSVLSACDRTDNDPGPGGVTVGEAEALDEAAATLDARTVAGDVPDPDQPPAP